MKAGDKDILVIGGGIIGVSCAYYLARWGFDVTLLERDEICAGSSAGNAGLIANGFAIPLAAPGMPLQGLKMLSDPTSPFYIQPRLNFGLLAWLLGFTLACNERKMRAAIPVLLALGQATFDLLDELIESRDVDFGFEKKGRVVLFTRRSTFESWQRDAALVGEFGVETVMLDAPGVREYVPAVQPAVQYGIYCPSYGHVDPRRFTLEMARLARQTGVKIVSGAEVTGFVHTGNHIEAVKTTRGEFPAGQVVLAAGAWSPLLARQVGIRLPIQPAKGYSLTFARPNTAPDLPLSLAEAKIAVTPMGEHLRLTSTLELVGYDSSINPRRIAAIRRGVGEYLPGMDTLRDEEQWSGFRPATPDDLPIIQRSRRVKNLILATGHGTLGMTHSLITGKMVAQIAAGEKPEIQPWTFKW